MRARRKSRTRTRTSDRARPHVFAASLALLACLLLLAPRLEGQTAPVETLILSPEPGERIPQDAVLVAASFLDRDRRLDPASIIIEVDGRNVTPEAEISAEVVTWRPRQPLVPGPHRVTLSARDRNGAPIRPSSWAFTVERAAETAAAAQLRPRGEAPAWTRLRGSLIFEGAAQSVSGPGAEFRRAEDVQPRLWLNAGGIIGGSWRYSARIHLSGYESSTRQPVSRYRFDIRSEHLDATIGDMNPAIQDLILSGMRVRGLQASVRGAGLGLTVIKGQSRRAISGLLDPTDPTEIARSGTFGQDLFAVRPTFGSGRTFQLGLTLLRVRDDTASIPELRTQHDLPGGSTRSVNPLPKDNLVVGADLTLRLLSGRVLLQYENGFSLLANDISAGALTEASLDSIMEAAGYDPLGIDPSRYEKYFILNASMIPLDPRGLTNIAQQVRTSLRTGSNILSVEWRSIGGSYYTLGYPALQRDRRGIRIRDSFTLLDNALALSAGFERDEDNLDDVKPATTTNTGVFATLSWQRSAQSPAVVASVRQGTRKNDLAVAQDGALDETNQAFSVGASYPVGSLRGLRTKLNLNLSFIDRDDPANPTAGSQDRYYLGGFQGETPDRSTELTLMYGLNQSTLTGFANAQTDFHRLVLNGRQLVAPRWTATLDGTYTAATSPQAAADLGLKYNRLELLAGAEFEWSAASFITFSAGVISYKDQRFPSRDTREVVTRLRVTRAF